MLIKSKIKNHLHIFSKRVDLAGLIKEAQELWNLDNAYLPFSFIAGNVL